MLTCRHLPVTDSLPSRPDTLAEPLKTSAEPSDRPPAGPPVWPFDNSFARDLPEAYLRHAPAKASEPGLVYVNHGLAAELGLDLQALDQDSLAQIFTGQQLPVGADPIAQAYAGHQFGGFSPQLGDGRALLLGELIDRHGQRRDIAFKGSGRTPFSRGGDGKAALGPVLREVLIGEAMHGLGIPTTRALAAAVTGDPVFRERPLPGAVLTRVAASHLRVGSFQFFAARRRVDQVQRLANYAIARHDPALIERFGAPPVPEPLSPIRPHPIYLAFLHHVRDRQIALITQWMSVGFIHGVMNTDNMTISGETIDYGPCSFMDFYDPATVYSSIDHHGRYAYANQPQILGWNLARLAETLLPLIDDDEDRAVDKATEVLEQVDPLFRMQWLHAMGRKLGLERATMADLPLLNDWLTLLQQAQVDFTLAFRRLPDALVADDPAATSLPADGVPASLVALWRDPGNATAMARAGISHDQAQQALSAWLVRWRDAVLRQHKGEAVGSESELAINQLIKQQIRQQMHRVNPAVIARNHLVERALAVAGEHDFQPLERLLTVLAQPYAEPGTSATDLLQPPTRLQAANYRTFCGT